MLPIAINEVLQTPAPVPSASLPVPSAAPAVGGSPAACGHARGRGTPVSDAPGTTRTTRPITRPRRAGRGWTDLGSGRPELRAWAFYDWANSAFLTTIVAAVFPVYYNNVAAKGLAPEAAAFNFSMATTVALAISAVIAPVLGAVADHRP